MFARVPVHFSERLFRQGISEGRHPAEGRLLCRKAAGSERGHCRAAGGNGGAAARHAQPTEEELFFHGGHSPERPMNQTVFSCGKSALSQLEKLIRSNRGEETLAALGRMYARDQPVRGHVRRISAPPVLPDHLSVSACGREPQCPGRHRADGFFAVHRGTAGNACRPVGHSAPDRAGLFFRFGIPPVPSVLGWKITSRPITATAVSPCRAITGELGFTNSYLCAAYKKSCGKTVNQRLTEIRLHHAKELLAGTSRRLYEIANAVGYGDGKYFVKLFTREVGLSPREYRGRRCV